MRKKLPLILKEWSGERSSFRFNMMSRRKAWIFCSHFSTMTKARLEVKLESWKAEQREEKTWSLWTNQPSHHLWLFYLCEPINPLYFSRWFKLGFLFLATESKVGWLLLTVIETWKRQIASSCQPTIKSRYIEKAIGPAWQCLTWPLS